MGFLINGVLGLIVFVFADIAYMAYLGKALLGLDGLTGSCRPSRLLMGLGFRCKMFSLPFYRIF